MIEETGISRLSAQLGFLALIVFYLALRVMPIDLSPHLILPDVLLLSTMALCLRRPDVVPIALVCFLGLAQDILTEAPIGLATIVLLLTHYYVLRRRTVLRANLFINEWGSISIIVAAALIIGELIKLVFFVPRLGFSTLVVTITINSLAYPLVAGLAHLLFVRGRANGSDHRSTQKRWGA